jgi:hypothetical protein
MGEQISITNLSTTSALDFHFFQYADFDLGAADSVKFTNANSVQQTNGSTRLTETVVTPIPSHHEAAFFPVTLNRLNDGLTTTLSDAPAIGSAFGTGDVTWAYQWDVQINPGDTFQISKDKNLEAVAPVPEPASLSLVIMGAAAILVGYRKRIVRVATQGA